jgi:hypothetical protein
MDILVPSNKSDRLERHGAERRVAKAGLHGGVAEASLHGGVADESVGHECILDTRKT